jgi:hypothetical protein
MWNKTIRTFTLVVVASVAVAAAGIAFASGNTGKRARWPIGAFSHQLTRAHSASITPSALSSDSGVALAVVKGENEIYVGHRENQALDCIYDHINIHAGGGGCGKATFVESQGMIGTLETAGEATRVLALVPDGVGNIVVTNQDGSSHSVTVENNVAIDEDPTPATVSFTLPNGVTRTKNVTGWVTPLADLRPGAANSSEAASSSK